jgi:hypothetical protein
MTERPPASVTNLGGTYGFAPLLWDRVRDPLAAEPPPPGIAFFLGTSRPDGRPHAAPIGAVWLEGDIYLVSGPGTLKSRNLARQPACTISVSLPGIDVVFEGAAQRITDRATLERLAAIYRGVGWPAEVAGEAFTAPYSAPSAGPPPWYLYRFRFHKAVGVATAEPHGATRWRFTR